MKKLFVSIILNILALYPAAAQDALPGIPQETPLELPQEAPKSFPKNEIGVSLCLGTGLQGAGIIGSRLLSLIGTVITNDLVLIIPTYIPGLTISYDHWLNEKFAVGVNVGVDAVSGLPYMFVGNVCVAADFKYNWLDTGSLRMYSRACGGFMISIFANQDENGKLTSRIAREDMLLTGSEQATAANRIVNAVFPPFALQVNPLCVDVRTALNGVNFFAELGYGTQGTLQLGFKKMF